MPAPVSPQPRRTDIPVRQSESPNACGREAPWDSTEALAAFLAEHIIAYDPETGDYNRPPFASDIKEDKNDPIYNVHSYHTKVPPRSIVPYILHYTQPGDVMLDPFCGSGMTGVAAQMCVQPPADILAQFPEHNERVGPRVCILSDLSPAACHIAYNYNTPVDVDALRCEFQRIEAAVKDDFELLYGTEHYEPAVGLYDPSNSDLARRLKNPPETGSGIQDTLFVDAERRWELISRAEVEARLGYPVTKVRRDDAWADLDVTKVEQWVSIPASIQYTVWSDVYCCQGIVTVEEPTGKVSTRGKNVGKPIVAKKRVARGCGKSFSLWEAAVDLEKGIIASSFMCPHCLQEWEKRQLQKTHDAPVLVTYAWPRLVKRAGASQLRTVRNDRPPTARELAHLKDVSSRPPQSWCPRHPIDMGREMMRHGMSKQNLASIAEFWTPRNLHALAILWAEINRSTNPRVRNALRFAFSAILFRVSRRRIVYCPKGGGWASTVISGTLYIPSLNAEANAWESFAKKSEDVFALAAEIRSHNKITVHRGDASHMPTIADESIDYVFADPPFGQNIYYADCSLLWEAWLDDFTDEAKEIVVNERRQGASFKDLDAYGSLMERAFREMFRVLKPNRFATIEFNNSDGAVFETIKAAIQAAGFHIDNMLMLDKTGKTYKQMKAVVDGEEVVDKDVLFNLHKPAVARAEVRGVDRDLEHQIVDAVRQHLQTLPERIQADPMKYSDEHRTTATMNSMLMNVLIPRGVSVERLNLPFIERVCARYFRKVGQYWYLRGQAVGNGANQDGLFEEEVQVRDEMTAIEWLRQRLHAAPMLVGELKPFWMRATGLLPTAVSLTLSLEDLLAENFWRDLDTNRWREPTDVERERMNDDRSIRVLHDADRYVAGSLRRSTTDAERSDWIDVLFKACREVEDNEARSTPALRGFDCGEGYRLVARLFQTILKEHVPPADFTRAQKQAAAASKRITQDVREEDIRRQVDAGKKRGPTLFDMEDVT